MMIPALMAAIQLTTVLIAGEPMGADNQFWLRAPGCLRSDLYVAVVLSGRDSFGGVILCEKNRLSPWRAWPG